MIFIFKLYYSIRIIIAELLEINHVILLILGKILNFIIIVHIYLRWD